MPPRTFKLNSPTLAIREENDQRVIVTLPAGALVTFVWRHRRKGVCSNSLRS
jgi:hypothetical protein